MGRKALILCVDDEPVNLTIMQELLQDRYQLTLAKSGEDCLQQVSVHKPDLILLDVNMPDLDGLETCARLKAEPDTADIPIIFVSALASQDELMAGYEAGGDDYITKPFSEDILQKKIEIVLASQRRKRELKQISDHAVAALKNNLNTTEALGMVIKFLHQAQTALTLDELASNVFDCLREFDLDGSLLILEQPENRIWFSDDINRPMESQILESLRGQDRVVSFGTRLAINSDHATVLVRNLPSRQENIDRVRSQLSILIEGLDNRIQAMQTQMLLDQRRDLLARVLAAARENLARIDDLHQQQKTRSAQLLAEMRAELEQSLLQLDLPARQARAIGRIIDATAEKAESLLEQGLATDGQFQGIVDELSQALDEKSKEGESPG